MIHKMYMITSLNKENKTKMIEKDQMKNHNLIIHFHYMKKMK
jgi:hypothetical protein